MNTCISPRHATARQTSGFASFAALALTWLALSGCGEQVDCQALCQRTLACEVTFDAPDDPQGTLIDSGERTDLEACTLGCQAHPLVTVDRARCVDGVDTTNANSCQPEVLDCLDVNGAGN